MSSPGFTGGGAGRFPGRSIQVPSTMNNHPATTTTHHPSHPLYRTQQQLPSIFLDPTSHIAQRQQTSSLLGKRTLAEFQTHNLNNSSNNNNLNNNPLLSNYLLRSVKPRTFQRASSISPMVFSTSSGFPSQQRYGMPLLTHLRPNAVNLTAAQAPLPVTNSILHNTSFPNFAPIQNRVTLPTSHEQEKKMTMDHRLQELEKQLLEDNDDEEGDAISVITNSEWSDTIQSLITHAQNPTQKPVSSSPTSSTTSSNSSSSSVASAPGCSRKTLMESASAISEGKLEVASEILTRLAQGSSPNGNSDQRFTDCMVSALKSRMSPVEYPPPVVELFSREHAESTQLLFEHSFFFKVAFMAANLAILDAAFEDRAENANNNVRLCVVDFDIGHGKQYAALLHELSARLKGKPATLKIMAVAENGADEMWKKVGDMLGGQAEKLGIGFKFKVVTRKLTELTRESLGCEPDEPLAVNFAFKLYRMPDESVTTENPRDELLRRVKALEPRVVTLVEQELNTNTTLFAARVAESCSYYGALFDSIESTMARDNSERVKIELGLSRKVGNTIACEGRDRVERCEVFGKWRARMSMAGLSLKPVSQRVAESIKARLGPANRVTVKEENGGVCFGWMGRTLTVASAWR